MSNDKSSLWMAARIARSLTGSSRTRINPVLGPLLTVHRRYHPRAEVEILNRAYALSLIHI